MGDLYEPLAHRAFGYPDPEPRPERPPRTPKEAAAWLRSQVQEGPIQPGESLEDAHRRAGWLAAADRLEAISVSPPHDTVTTDVPSPPSHPGPHAGSDPPAPAG